MSLALFLSSLSLFLSSLSLPLVEVAADQPPSVPDGARRVGLGKIPGARAVGEVHVHDADASSEPGWLSQVTTRKGPSQESIPPHLTSPIQSRWVYLNPMEFHVSLIDRKDLSGEIYRQIRRAIVDGRLRPGELLPPSRELARRLSVSRTTVTVAYDRLAGEGLVSSQIGAATFVNEHVAPLPDEREVAQDTAL